ncbi:hypothetical protein HJC23_003910 [Cyclotella cryptica]|uniref:O-fucosyltransferase family protein n=1 Tax=Cyclotella cryptica TaxID=29204 RepID=A0ABD3PUC0_9STRA|eukprot:CCRYP_011443-RA/>CCRYP_011443-RA protein AED:0.03 eAED:0.03 QI:230/0/0/1/0/0/2/379/498
MLIPNKEWWEHIKTEEVRHEVEFSISSSQIDYTVNERVAWKNEDKCDNIILFMPYFFSGHGHGFQLNCYLMAVVVAAFLDKALVILEPPHSENRFDTWSQFGCPADAFEDESYTKIKDGFPEGLQRLIQNPQLISRGCGVPTCGGTMSYHQWAQIQAQQRGRWGNGRRKPASPPIEYDCVEDGRNIKVIPLGGPDLRTFCNRMYWSQMMDRTSPNSREAAYNWATRLGARPHEAAYFSELRGQYVISDYLSAIVNRSGLLKFQPWVARDVSEYIKSSNLPRDGSYDGIHVRRGDKLLVESKWLVENYWRSKGYDAGNMPANYVPFVHYLNKAWDGSECPRRRNGRIRQTRIPRKVIYVATDDPNTVRKEIAQLPKVKGGYTVLNGCQKAEFIFSPSSETITSFHMTPCRKYLGTCGGDDCSKRYARSIAAIADLTILTRAEKFVGEYNSNWGRLIRDFRTAFKDNLGAPDPNNDSDEPLVLVRDIVEVFNQNPTPFGW